MLDQYFVRKPGAAGIPADTAAVGASVATDVWTTYRILRLKRAEREAGADFGAVLYWLGQLRNCRTRANCRALSSSRSNKPEVIDGRAHFVYPGMRKTHWS